VRLGGSLDGGRVRYPKTPPASSSLELSNDESRAEVKEELNDDSCEEVDENDAPRLRRMSLKRGGRSALRKVRYEGELD
jgi:hypothetical protein